LCEIAKTKQTGDFDVGRGEGEVSICPLYLPGRLRAGSIASGLLVVAITKTAFLSLLSVDGKG